MQRTTLNRNLLFFFLILEVPSGHLQESDLQRAGVEAERPRSRPVVGQVRDAGVLGDGLSYGKKGSASRDAVVRKMTLKFTNPAIGMVLGQDF